MSRFASLNDLYLDYLSSDIDIYVMGIGQNNNTPVDDMTANNNLPWVKDNSENNIWSAWGVSNRDLFIMDMNNRIVKVINLTSGFDETSIKSIIDCMETLNE